METTKFELTKKELKEIINYIRQETRLSYELQKMLWLVKESNEIKKKVIPLAERFNFSKQDLRRVVKNREILNHILKGDEIEKSTFNSVRLKKEVKTKLENEYNKGKEKK